MQFCKYRRVNSLKFRVLSGQVIRGFLPLIHQELRWQLFEEQVNMAGP